MGDYCSQAAAAVKMLALAEDVIVQPAMLVAAFPVPDGSAGAREDAMPLALAAWVRRVPASQHHSSQPLSSPEEPSE